MKCFLECESLGRSDAWIMIGRCYLAMNRTGEAILALLTHIARFPEDGLAYFHLGRAYLSARKFSMAVIQFLQARELGLQHRQFEAFLGWSLLKTRKTDQARQVLEIAVMKNPHHSGIYQLYLNSILVWAIDAFRKEKYQPAKDALIFLMNNGHREFLVRLYLAASFRELGELTSSYALYRELHREEPHDLSFSLNLWELAHRLGLFEEAQHWEGVIHKLAPERALPSLDDVFPLVARTQFETGRYRQAIFYALKALKNRRHPRLHFLVGLSYYHLGNINKAINHLRQGLKLAPDEEVSLTLLKYLCESRRWEEARHELRVFQDRYPESPKYHYFKVLVDAKLSREGVDHVQNLKKALKVYPSDPLLFSVLGEVYIKQDNRHDAQLWLSKALELDPEDDQTLELYLKIDDPPPSRDILEYCHQKRRRHHADLNRIYAHLLLKTGEAEKARHLILENLKIDSDHDLDWTTLAEAERILENYSASYAIWVRQLRKSPENRRAILHLFYLLYKMNQTERAERFKFQVIQRLNDHGLHYSFAKAYEKLGLFDLAAAEYREHLAIFPHHTKSKEDLAALLKKHQKT